MLIQAEEREILLMETLILASLGRYACSSPLSLARSQAIQTTSVINGSLQALLQLADSDYQGAATSFSALHEQFPDDAMVGTDLAVCLLYTGRILDAKVLLSKLVQSSRHFTLLSSTCALCMNSVTETNRDKKVALATKLRRGRKEVV